MSSHAVAPKRRAKFIVGAALLAVSLVALVVWAMGRSGATSFYLKPSELETRSVAAGDDLRVAGNVVPGSLEQRGVETEFAISDGAASVTVVTDATLPDAFYSGYENDPTSIEVVAQGRYDGRRFSASQVVAKCPSKFKAKV